MTSQPIIPGFYPDPSICRAGDTFWLINSSFEYLPGLPVHTSTDLITWTPAGNALTRPSQIPEHAGAASSSVFAPTIRHHDGRFWIVWTDHVRLVHGAGQFIITAEDPAGPWSDPVEVPGTVGIDPDLCWGEDGTCHLTWAAYSPTMQGIASVPIDPATGAMLGEPKLLWQGTGGAHPEGPHLYRCDGWWYLLIAEGGTERGHAVTIARSRTLDGPFESAPNNPILTHRGTAHPVQNTGHADLVELADGSWAMVYLGVRPRGVTPGFHVNGRETFLAAVDWIDGWPVVDQDRYQPAAVDHSFADDFIDATLDLRWLGVGMFPGTFTRPASGSGLVLDAESGGPGVPLLATRARDEAWTSIAIIEPTNGGAGCLELRIDERHHCSLTVDENAVQASLTIGPATQMFGRLDIEPDQSVALQIRVRLPESNPYWPADEVDVIQLSVLHGVEERLLGSFDGRYLSTEVAGKFTGRVVGVRALRGTVTLRRFTYESGK